MKRWIGIGMLVVIVVPCIGVIAVGFVASWPHACIGAACGLAIYMWTCAAGRLMESGRVNPRKLSNAELLKLAERFPAPQEWYDE